MPLINLIQEQRLAAKKNERKARMFFFTFAGTFVGAVGALGLVFIQTESLQSEEARLRNQLRHNEPLVAQIEANQKTLSTLTPRLKTLEDAQTVSNRWLSILHHIETQTPEKIWLTAIRTMGSDPTKPISINLVGIAPSQDPVGEFMLRMENSKDLENVQLKYTSEKLAADVKGTEFEVDADIVDTTEKRPKKEEDK